MISVDGMMVESLDNTLMALHLKFGDDVEVVLTEKEAVDLRDYLIENYPLGVVVKTSPVVEAALAVEKSRS